jgi:hypothetical protein
LKSCPFIPDKKVLIFISNSDPPRQYAQEFQQDEKIHSAPKTPEEKDQEER